jgi:hypothetical protein
MASKRSNRRRVLAIVPHSKGIGFAVFEGPARPIDWGVKRITGDKNAASLSKCDQLFADVEPDVLILEDLTNSRRCTRVTRLIKRMSRRAQQHGLDVVHIGRHDVMAFFSTFEAQTKQEVATVIAASLPALRPRLPKPRKPWQSEDYRMSIFQAAALVSAFYGKIVRHKSRRPSRPPPQL